MNSLIHANHNLSVKFIDKIHIPEFYAYPTLRTVTYRPRCCHVETCIYTKLNTKIIRFNPANNAYYIVTCSICFYAYIWLLFKYSKQLLFKIQNKWENDLNLEILLPSSMLKHCSMVHTNKDMYRDWTKTMLCNTTYHYVV